MELKVNVGLLLKAMKIVKPSTNVSVIPITSTVRLDVEKRGIKLTGNNLSCCIESFCEADVKKTGSVCVDAARLFNGLSSLPLTSTVALTDKNNVFKVSYGSGSMSMPSLNADEFPVWEWADAEVKFDSPTTVLSQAIKAVHVSASSDEMRPEMCGVCFSSKDGAISLKAAKSSSLAIKHDVSSCDGIDLDTIIDSSMVGILLGFMSSHNDANVSIGFSNKQLTASVVGDESRIGVTSVDGKFPDIMALISAVRSSDGRIFTIPTEDLIGSLKRISGSVNEAVPSFSINAIAGNAGQFILSSSNIDLGLESKDEMAVVTDVTFDEDERIISFNIHDMKKVVQQIEDASFSIKVCGKEKPALIEAGNYTVVMAPIMILD